jgi:hypothetical protein
MKISIYWLFFTKKYPYSLLEFIKTIKILFFEYKKIIVVYDVKSAPPTYGDFLMVVLCARAFLALGWKVQFCMIIDNFRYDWYYYDLNRRIEIIDEFKSIAKLLLNSNKAVVTLCSFEEFKNIKDISNSYVIFKSRVFKRILIYNLMLHYISLIYLFYKNKFIFNFLISKNDFINVKLIKEIPGNYLTWHIRYNLKYESERNMDEAKFILIYNSLRTNFPNKYIMVISDENGCAFGSKVISKNNLNKIFLSKNFSNSFLGDAKLINLSDYHYMFTGGGISLFAMFSDMPYECIFFHNEICWSKKKILSWSHSKQMVTPIYSNSIYFDESFLPTLSDMK